MTSLTSRFLTVPVLIFALTATALGSGTPPYTDTPVDRFARVDRTLYRGAAPQNDAEMAALHKLGIKTIINLENSKKKIERESEAARRADLRFISVPLSGFFAPSDKDADEILRAMIDPSLQPVFIHCAYGRERTGMMVALYRFFYDHWTAGAAYQEMKDFGFRTITFPMINYIEYRTGSDL